MVEVSTNHDIAAHKELVVRVLASNRLNKSARLTELFQYLCARVLEDDVQEIHEMELGHHVFGRPPRYDTVADNIVRVHASLLRKRLAEYFLTEGRDEEFRIFIRRGNYAPLFCPREPDEGITSLENGSEPPLSSSLPVFPNGVHTPSIQEGKTSDIASSSRRRGWTFWFFPALAAVLAVFLVVICLRLQKANTQVATLPSPFSSGDLGQFWSSIFPAKQETDVVADDASLAFYEEVTGHTVPIGEYFDRTYLRELTNGPDLAKNPSWLSQLLLRRQSNYADATMMWRMAEIASARGNTARLQFARDLSFRQAKSENLILLGTPASNPWIQLFESNMTLHWEYDSVEKVYYPVDTTLPDQKMQYKAVDNSKTRDGYATIALLPNLDGTGNVLILSGTGGAVTDAVMEWLREESSLAVLRSRLTASSGHGFPHFEALLRISKGTDRPRNVTVIAVRPPKSSSH